MFSNWIKECIKSAEVLNQQFIFVVARKHVCLAGFCALYGILAYKFNIARDIINNFTIYKNKEHTFIYPWRNFLFSWFTNLIALFCNIMPNSNNCYSLVYFTKGDFYDSVVLEFEAKYGTKFSSFSFRGFWKENFKTVCIPKSLTMGQYSACLELKAIKSNGKSRIEIARLQVEYNKLYASARQYCNGMRATAQQQPFNVPYLQFDGKQASYLPHIILLPKDTQNISRVRIHIYGISNFSDNSCHFFLTFPHWTAGPNLSITILYNSILRYFNTVKHQRPSKLVLQVNNCAKDGKNKYIFAFAAH
jgi:hypothetical protein